MIFYKYTKKPGLTRIPGYESASNMSVISKYLDTDSILSEMKPITENGKEFVGNMADGLLYPLRSNTRENFTQSIVIDSLVTSTCKLGLAVFDSTKSERKEIYRLGKNDHVIMNMGFVTDAENNIWASVSVIDSDFSYVVEKGYVIYKNNRNNFTNLYIPDAKYKTVLTAGKLDDEKVRAVQNQDNNGIALMSNSSENLRDLSATTNVSWGSTGSTGYVRTTTNDNYQQSSYISRIAQHAPSIVQNNSAFPRVIGKVGEFYQYDYTIDCNLIAGLNDLSSLHRTENLEADSIRLNFKKNICSYNRFKKALPDDILSRGFMHIFFTRPDCNLLSPSTGKLLGDIKDNPSLSYIYNRKPELVRELVLQNGVDDHDFMMLLSNKAKNFSITDEGITYDKYGKTFGGYSVAFGRRKDSELGGQFDISYNDTRDLDIINLHKLWIDYINNVYRGIWNPKIKYIYQKIIDYACSVYVIITAEDFETILFWTKYYGVFPVNVPYNALSWQANSVITNPEVSVTYQYSWKEDYNPLGLTELNINTFRTNHPKQIAYIPTYVPELGRTGHTWVGAPFVETIKFGAMDADKTNGTQVTSKLRFKKG